MKVLKRVGIIEWFLASFLIINIGLAMVNKKLVKPLLPMDIMGFIFAFSMGLYIGFLICKNEIKKVLKERNNNR